MLSLPATITKKGLAAILRRNFFKGCTVNDYCDGEGQEEKNKELLLKPLTNSESCTLRKHDNDKRQKLYEFGLYVAACLPKWVQKVVVQHSDELEILVAPEGLYQVNSFMRNHQNCCFNQCSGATAIDVPGRVYRFEVVYLLCSLRYSERVQVKTYTDELTPLHSQYDHWNSCNWFEREIYDMFGVVFTHHPDLRRILTDYGFEGHPLRKDFPLIGYTEVRYDDEIKKLVYEPVEFAQCMRKYQIQTPWHYLKNFHGGNDCPPAPPASPET